MPRTVKFSSSSLKIMLNKFKKVYVKATLSGQGRHVFEVTKNTTSKYVCKYFKQKKTTYKTKNFRALLKKLKQLLNGRKAIVQQAIYLPNKKIDLRVETQRNKHNNIEVVGTGVRVGDKSTPILNTRSKPKFYDIDYFFTKT